ncbi:MAG: pteridine-dependent deoxygenase [Tahibacter sp.]
MTPLAPLSVRYARTGLAQLLGRDDLLAVLGFGDGAPASDDPRYLRVGLQPCEGEAPFEVWQVPGPVEHGRDGLIRWAASADYLFGAIEIDEVEHGGIRSASSLAYRAMADFLRSRRWPHLLRIWNYLAAINHGAGDAERYKQFCVGRAEGMGQIGAQTYPAASAIGRSDGVGRLQLYWLSARSAGVSVENPRQVSAWCYPREYGPTAPTFARATLGPTIPPQLHISGTAAVVGHASRHTGDLAAQLDETFANLDSLRASAGHRDGFDGSSVLKAYVRHAADAEPVSRELQRRLPPEVARLVLLGDICRAELLVEIDGLHGSASAPAS